jgi:hypothetical protein
MTWAADSSSSAYEPLSSAASSGFDPWAAWARDPAGAVAGPCPVPCPVEAELGLSRAPRRPTSRIPWPSPAERWLPKRPRFGRRLRSAPRAVRAPTLSASPKNSLPHWSLGASLGRTVSVTVSVDLVLSLLTTRHHVAESLGHRLGEGAGRGRGRCGNTSR